MAPRHRGVLPGTDRWSRRVITVCETLMVAGLANPGQGGVDVQEAVQADEDCEL